MIDRTTLLVSAVLFFATIIRSSLGFGEALVAVPLLALLIPVEVAAPVAVLVSITVALIAVIQDWKHVELGSAARLALPTLFGIPLGLLLLKYAPETVVKLCLATVIITFALYSMLSRKRGSLKNDRFAWMFGFSAGIIGGAYGMNGPPLAIYGSLRGWSPEKFRATLQGYFLPASMAGMFGYWLTGLWIPKVSHYFLTALPAVIIAVLLGRAINRKLHPQRFLVYVNAGLIGIGLILLIQAIR